MDWSNLAFMLNPTEREPCAQGSTTLHKDYEKAVVKLQNSLGFGSFFQNRRQTGLNGWHASHQIVESRSRALASDSI
jgi:hypothetical protein